MPLESTSATDPIFMSPEHIAIMNERLAASPEVEEILAGNDQPLVLLYELKDGPGGETVYWSLEVGDVVRFGLDAHPGADVILRGDWKGMILMSSGKDGDAQIVPDGNLELMPRIMELIEAIRPYGAVPVNWPEL